MTNPTPEQTTDASGSWDQLLDAAVAIDQALDIEMFQNRRWVVYTGSWEQAEAFRRAVLEALHVRTG